MKMIGSVNEIFFSQNIYYNYIYIIYVIILKNRRIHIIFNYCLLLKIMIVFSCLYSVNLRRYRYTGIIEF